VDKNQALDIVQDFAKALKNSGIHVDKMILFGSYSTGTYHEGSDIDLVVVSDDFVGKDHEDRFEMVLDALYETWQPIEPRMMTVEEWAKGDSTVAVFAKEGEAVYTA